MSKFFLGTAVGMALLNATPRRFRTLDATLVATASFLTEDDTKPKGATMDAYDLYFERESGVSLDPERGDVLPTPDRDPDGWIGSAGPAIDPATWPRGPLTGLPMFHAVTLRLPVEYQRKGPEYPGIAFFQGEGQFAEELVPIGGDDPFAADVATSHPHPQFNLRTDIIDGQFALLWLTEEELSGGPIDPPPDTRRPGEHKETDEGANAWHTMYPVQRVWLVTRDDPNAGFAPCDPADGGYQDPYDSEAGELHVWADPLFGRCHLGGTSFPVQAMPEGLTPYYLEIEEFNDLNFGTGNAQIDLESETFDWACD